jgi:hypothetical protein
MPSRTLGAELQVLLDNVDSATQSTDRAATSFSFALYDLQDRLVNQIRRERKRQWPIPVLETDAMFEPLTHLLFTLQGDVLPSPKSFSPYYPAWSKFTQWLESEELKVEVERLVTPMSFTGSRGVVLILTFLPTLATTAANSGSAA